MYIVLASEGLKTKLCSLFTQMESFCQLLYTVLCINTSSLQSQRALDDAHHEIQQLKTERNMYEQNMKQAFMRGVCALNMEAMTMFRQNEGTGDYGNGLAPPTGDEGSTDGQESTSSLEGPLTQSLPSAHHYSNQTQGPLIRPSLSVQHLVSHGNQTSHSSQPALCTPYTIPTSHASHVTTSVQIQTSQPKVRTSTRGHSSVGAATQKKGCGRPKPVIMVERHTLE